ncbi:MAG: hypothetical protein DMD81_20475 [Candidatus Rokuibacteriota bacterium]|nr:MAG: hypothetical protein DMD81_20475 [Candidatus Rokubacteria bacterium]
MHSITGRKRILHVEDDHRVAGMLKECLEELYVIESVRDGESALAAFVETVPDLVLLDINLYGEMSGLEVLRRLRGIDPTVPVIVTTGTDDYFTITTVLMRGAFAYIPKPVPLEHLLHLVSAAIPEPASIALIPPSADPL